MKPDMKARISQLCKTEAEWLKLPTFVPFKGEFIIYDIDEQHTQARLKIGDGVTPLKDLSFFAGIAKADSFITELDTIVDAGRITEYKN